MPIDHVAISLEARIVAVADMFDALTSERPYKGVWTNDAAAAFLQEQAARKFQSGLHRGSPCRHERHRGHPAAFLRYPLERVRGWPLTLVTVPPRARALARPPMDVRQSQPMAGRR
ncbi:HD domain-containing phosphohydrolase [Azospirillum argentinense]